MNIGHILDDGDDDDDEDDDDNINPHDTNLVITN